MSKHVRPGAGDRPRHAPIKGPMPSQRENLLHGRCICFGNPGLARVASCRASLGPGSPISLGGEAQRGGRKKKVLWIWRCGGAGWLLLIDRYVLQRGHTIGEGGVSSHSSPLLCFIYALVVSSLLVILAYFRSEPSSLATYHLQAYPLVAFSLLSFPFSSPPISRDREISLQLQHISKRTRVRAPQKQHRLFPPRATCCLFSIRSRLILGHFTFFTNQHSPVYFPSFSLVLFAFSVVCRPVSRVSLFFPAPKRHHDTTKSQPQASRTGCGLHTQSSRGILEESQPWNRLSSEIGSEGAVCLSPNITRINTPTQTITD